MMEMACQVEGKEEGPGEGGWIWLQKIWKGLELEKETKSIRSNGEYFHAVATRLGRSRKKKKNFKTEHQCQSPLLVFVIARISIQKTNLHLKVERSGLGASLCNKILNLTKDQN